MFVLMCSGNQIHTYVFNVVYACFYLRFQTNEFYHCSFPHGPPSKFISYQSRKVQRSATCSTLMEKNYLLHTKCTHCLIVTLWCFSIWLFWNLSESIPLPILECLILRLRSIVIWNFNSWPCCSFSFASDHIWSSTIPILLRIGMSYFPSFANLSMHYCTRAVILFASPGLDNAN